jgi:hypothetical protein
MLHEAFQSAAASLITVSSTAGTLFSFINTAGTTTAPRAGFTPNVNGVDLCIEAQPVRILFGQAPTATNGFLLSPGSIYRFRNVNLEDMQLIKDGATDSTISVLVGQCDRGETSNSSQYSAT